MVSKKSSIWSKAIYRPGLPVFASLTVSSHAKKMLERKGKRHHRVRERRFQGFASLDVCPTSMAIYCVL